MKTQKLIKEYEKKVLLMDTIIDKSTKAIRKMRNDAIDTSSYLTMTAPFVEDRKIAEAKRQNYIQFIVDLKTLDYV
tara:strand:+ start:188 stop:415 length:228 start_codon:yes stop_codon:yes gene_type:complete